MTTDKKQVAPVLAVSEEFKISVTVILKRKEEPIIPLIRVQGRKSYNSKGYCWQDRVLLYFCCTQETDM